MAQSPDQPSAKKLHIKTFGCQMNAYVSERMAEALQPAGFQLTGQMAEADLVILNTCHIREKAAEKVYSELGRVRKAKEARKAEGRDTMIAVAGCVAQAEGKEILARAPAVDIAGGPQEPGLGLRHRAGGLRQVLHVLRGALHQRRGIFTERGRDRRRGGAAGDTGRARDHPARAERQRLSRRWARRRGLAAGAVVAAARRNPVRRALTLHHEPPPRHGRGTDRAVRR